MSKANAPSVFLLLSSQAYLAFQSGRLAITDKTKILASQRALHKRAVCLTTSDVCFGGSDLFVLTDSGVATPNFTVTAVDATINLG